MAPILGHAELLGWVRRRWPQEWVWAGRSVGASPPRLEPTRPPPATTGRPGRSSCWSTTASAWSPSAPLDKQPAGLQLDPTWNRRPAGDPAQASATAPHGSRRPPRRRPGLHCLPGPGRRDWLPTAQLGQLDRERCHRVARSAPKLLALPGGRTLTAAKPSSSPTPPPWPRSPSLRQHRSPVPVADGNRQPHAALYRIAITQLRLPGPARPTTSGAAPRMTSPARPCPPLQAPHRRCRLPAHLKQTQQPSTAQPRPGR
jgi:hypothetical protein